MKSDKITPALMVVMLMGLVSCATSKVMAPAPTTDDDELAIRLASSEGNVRQAAVAEAARHGPGAILAVGELLASPDHAVVKNAELALWAVANACAAPGAGLIRAQASAACLDLLERKAKLPRGRRVTIIRVLSSIVNDEEGVRRLAGHIDDPRIGDMVCWALERITHPAAEKALLSALERGTSPNLQRIVIALGVRRARAAVAPLLAVERKAEDELAANARHALARIGDPQAEGLLRAVAKSGTWEDRDNLLTLADSLMASDDSRGRRIYIDLMHDDHPHLRVAAVRAIGRLGYESMIPELVGALRDDVAGVRAEAADALRAMADGVVDERLEEEWHGGPGAPRASVLRVMAARDSAKAAPFVVAALSDRDAGVRLAALELAACIDHPSVEPALMRAARDGTDEERAAALLGYLAHADMRRHGGDDRGALRMIEKTIELSDSDAVLSRALRELMAMGRPEALPLLERLEGRDSQRENLAQVRFAIARTLAADSPDQAIAQLEKVYQESRSRWRRQAAVAKLTALGVDTTNYSARSGFFSAWYLLGPFAEATEENLGSQPFGDLPPQVAGPFESQDGTLSWKSYQTEDMDGRVDLRKLFDEKEHVCAYAFTTFEWPAAAEVLLMLGSDDGVAVWLNGRLVHQNFVARGLQLDQDRAAVNLRKGTNTLLVKITQGGGDWEFCVRLADPDGHPLDIRKAVRPLP